MDKNNFNNDVEAEDIYRIINKNNENAPRSEQELGQTTAPDIFGSQPYRHGGVRNDMPDDYGETVAPKDMFNPSKNYPYGGAPRQSVQRQNLGETVAPQDIFNPARNYPRGGAPAQRRNAPQNLGETSAPQDIFNPARNYPRSGAPTPRRNAPQNLGETSAPQDMFNPARNYPRGGAPRQNAPQDLGATTAPANAFNTGNASNNTDSVLEDAQDLYQTMALQMEYTDSLREKKDTRKMAKMEFVEIDPQKSEEITRKLIEIYGPNSIQVIKWTEQLRKIETYKEAQKKAIKKRKRQTIIMGALSALGVLVIAAIVIFVLNSTTYYINQGDYNHIYKKPLFGAPELYLDKSVLSMTKDGSNLYYLAKDDNKIYSISTKTDEITELSEDTVDEFKVANGGIYYVNSADKTLCRINTDGSDRSQIYNKPCGKLDTGGDDLTFEDTETGQKMTVNTKTRQVSSQ